MLATLPREQGHTFLRRMTRMPTWRYQGCRTLHRTADMLQTTWSQEQSCTSLRRKQYKATRFLSQHRSYRFLDRSGYTLRTMPRPARGCSSPRCTTRRQPKSRPRPPRCTSPLCTRCKLWTLPRRRTTPPGTARTPRPKRSSRWHTRSPPRTRSPHCSPQTTPRALAQTALCSKPCRA